MSPDTVASTRIRQVVSNIKASKMTSIPLRYVEGGSLSIRSADGVSTELFKIKERFTGGFSLSPFDGSGPQRWSDDDLNIAYGNQRIIYYPANLQNIKLELARLMEKTWDYWPAEVQKTARRRYEFVREVSETRDQFTTLAAAYEAASNGVWDRFGTEWADEDREALGASAEKERRRRRRNPIDEHLPQTNVRPFKKPSPAAIRRWYLLYTENGRDVRLLIRLDHLKGDRTPRYDDPRVYELMKQAANERWLVIPRRTKRAAFDHYKELCGKHGIKPASENTFREFIFKTYSDFEEYKTRHGGRAAYLRFGLFSRRTPPTVPLDEVEIDHCLIDMIVVDPKSGKPRGRPWLTAVQDRATRAIVGMHLSFEPPSYTSLSRALIHAFWPKDVSGVPGLENHDWPCFGVPGLVFVDNGREFRCRSLREAEADLQFSVINLPVKAPWLKGAVERLFGTIGVQVFSKEEGSTKSRTPDVYDPVKHARHTLESVAAMLVKWIVTDYHERVHPTIGCKPIDKWRSSAMECSIPVVRDFNHVIQMLGQTFDKPISNVGVHWDGLLFSSPDLGKLLKRRNGLKKKWKIRVNSYDLSKIFLLDDVNGRWITLLSKDPNLTDDLTKAQHATHLAIARKNNGKGVRLTVGMLEEAKAIAQGNLKDINLRTGELRTATRAARYECNGAFLTPVGDGFGPSLLDRATTSTITVPPPGPHPASPKQPAPRRPPIPDLAADVDAAMADWDPAFAA